MRRLTSVGCTNAEASRSLPSDDIIRDPFYVIDRGMTLTMVPDAARAWIGQIGPRKHGRAGWYMPRGIERLLPKKYRSLRHLDPRLFMETGDRFRDWFEGSTQRWVTVREATKTSIVLVGDRGETVWSWAFTFTPGEDDRTTRVHFRFRITKVKIRGRRLPLGMRLPDWYVPRWVVRWFEPLDYLYMELFRIALNRR